MGGLLALSALPGSLVGVFLFQGVSEGLFRFFFGLLLIVMGSFLILRSWRNKTGSNFFFAAKKSGGEASLIKQVEDTERLHSRTRWYARSPFFTGSGAIVLSFMVAALAAGMGIGGGIFYVPALIFLFRFPVHRATATSQFVMTVMSGSALILHVDRGHFERMPLLPVLWLVGGAILGAQCGARLGPKLRGSVVVTGLAFLTVTLGLRLLLGAIFSGNLGSMLKGLFQVA